MKLRKLLPLLAIATAFTAVNAQNYEQPFTKPSIYTVLVKSDEENAKLDYEIENPNLILKKWNEFKEQIKKDFINPGKSIIDLGSGLFGRKKKFDIDGLLDKLDQNDGVENTSIRSNVPQSLFPKIPTPDRFFDHNLDVRVIDLDKLKKVLTKEEIDEANKPFGESKASKVGNIIGGVGGFLGGGKKEQSEIANIDTISRLIPAALNKYFNEHHTPELLLAKWYDYNAKRKQKWSESLISSRGFAGVAEEEKEKAIRDYGTNAVLAGRGYDMLDKTFVVAINLRFRSNKAFMLEANEMANAAFAAGSEVVGAGKGKSILEKAFLIKEITELVASKAMTGYRVQATAFLYKIDWTDEASYDFATKIVDQNASLEDLINLGICRLIPLASSKGFANLNKHFIKEIAGVEKRSEKDLVFDATQLAINKALADLQRQRPEFCTYTHITSVGEDGLVYAKIGTKEGVAKGDKYEICEATLKENGRISYDKVATVSVVEDQIWENRPVESISPNEYNEAATKLGQTAFKKGKEDYVGYLLRLESKKVKKTDQKNGKKDNNDAKGGEKKKKFGIF